MEIDTARREQFKRAAYFCFLVCTPTYSRASLERRRLVLAYLTSCLPFSTCHSSALYFRQHCSRSYEEEGT